MQLDFHYYATYCAAFLAGWSHEESMEIAYSAQFVDCCSRALLARIRAPLSAATTQQQLELMDARTDILGLQDITRIWTSFHFLPYDLYADVHRGGKRYRDKYRLLCDVNGVLVGDTVRLAAQTGTLQAAGIAMHVLADTWAHRYFAGTPSLVINNTNYYFYELQDGEEPRQIAFRRTTGADDPIKGEYTATIRQSSERSVMNLGHGRAGHLPDYSYARYKYLPAWGEYEEVIKDNPSDYWHAFCQMLYALRCLKAGREGAAGFVTDRYDFETAAPYADRIMEILRIRRTDASDDWREFGEDLSRRGIDGFDTERYQKEYTDAFSDEKDDTYLGKFILAAKEQKRMVTGRIFESGNLLAGLPFSAAEKTGGGEKLKEYYRLVRRYRGKNDD